MELISNLIWAILSLGLLTATFVAVRRGRVKVSMCTAMTITVVMCFILMPLISVSDDLLEARQSALPISGQTWRMASEGVCTGLDELLMVALYLLLLMWFSTEAPMAQLDRYEAHALSERLVRSQRLRPPPFAVI